MDTFTYQLPYKGKLHKFSGNDAIQISAKVCKFLIDHNEKCDKPKIIASIENQMKHAPIQHTKKTPRLRDAFHAGMALLRAAGGKTVTQEVATARANICSTCPLMSKTSYCSGCGGLSFAKKIIDEARRFSKGQVTVPQETKDKFCGVCGCSLPLLLVTNSEYLPEDNPNQAKQRPDHCWLKK